MSSLENTSQQTPPAEVEVVIPVRIKIATFYILKTYSPIPRPGYRDSDLITSADLVRELAEMASISVSEVSELMWGADFKVVTSGGKVFWKVFRSEE